MAISEKQYEALVKQLEAKKSKLGDEGYKQFLEKAAATVEPTAPQPGTPLLQSVGTGAVKELGKTGIGIGSIGRGIQKGISSAVGAVTGTQNFGMGRESILDAGPKKDAALNFLEPKGAAEKTGAFLTEAATFAVPGGQAVKATKGASFLRRAAALGATDAAVTVGKQGEVNKETIDAAIIGAIFPVAGATKTAISKALPKSADAGGRVINSLIKPLLKDFSYGKNPGKAVAEAGITANSLDELANNIRTARQSVGQEISDKVAANTARFDATDSLKSIDEAITAAEKAPNTNSAIISRLKGVRDDLLQVNADGVPTRNLSDLSASELWEFNKEIGDLARWTGNASDDEITNKAIRAAYGATRGKLDNAVDGLAETSEKYANLKSAEVATEYRDKIAARAGLTSFSGTQIGTAGALVTAISTGGAAIPTILAGATAAAANEAFKSPAVKTRLAAWLATSSKAEKDQLFKQQPWLRGAVQAALFGESEDGQTEDK
jgi:hypothetical protein